MQKGWQHGIPKVRLSGKEQTKEEYDLPKQHLLTQLPRLSVPVKTVTNELSLFYMDIPCKLVDPVIFSSNNERLKSKSSIFLGSTKFFNSEGFIL